MQYQLYGPFSVCLVAICAHKKGKTCYYSMKLTKNIHGQILIFSSRFGIVAQMTSIHMWFDHSLIFKAWIEHQIKRTNLKLVFNFSDDE